MAESKQGHLNGAYYGPPVPPQRSYQSVGRSSSCGPCSLLCSLFKFLISIVIIFGIIVLVLWLIFRPDQLKVYVDSASLTQFNLSSSNNLQYNLNLSMSIRNPNKRIGIYYDYVEPRAYYDGDRFAFTTVPPFYQGHKNTSMIYPVFDGQQVLLGDSVNTTYNREKSEGYYYVDIKVYSRLRAKVAIFKIRYTKTKIDCSLKLPVPGSSSAAFERTKCDWDLF
ncbi:NDR1/HIN1-like protein 10 [Phoenix dactylifera]|uniref:NDR1/HIN1-like protein 10 n=1 Tax=Phoenix dactylifera TaxID=42345 RepID=A0A8B7BL61_PHODC|nr:NDR1/HIN1-like protein 10 [Phoenix dactylifera]